MFIDTKAKQRYRAIQAIAKTIRMKSNKQMTARYGRKDFLLRVRDRGDSTPWGAYLQSK